ncbi:hypothetical protein VP01_6900g1 [Puccinia sorghi]|uniref:Uncharacterized protein n=1 Tax=Puccinia sorghi TaxID=27349 RepID=A0A0L6UE79_9BASI|nr:hypothetical protein VP01_6900g1 [Puccinia sorghi]
MHLNADQIKLVHPCQEQKRQEKLGWESDSCCLKHRFCKHWLDNHQETQSFLKEDKFQADSHTAYLDWLEMVVNNGKSEVNLTLTMPNPSDVIKQAAKDDLLAAHAQQQAMKDTSAKRKSAAGKDEEDNLDDEELDTVDWEHIKTHMTKIYEHKLTKIKYDFQLPVYIYGANPHQYILITIEACQDWACALLILYFSLNSSMEQTPGVTPKSPPRSLPYITLKGAKQAKINELAPDPSPGGSSANTITPAQIKIVS